MYQRKGTAQLDGGAWADPLSPQLRARAAPGDRWSLPHPYAHRHLWALQILGASVHRPWPRASDLLDGTLPGGPKMRQEDVCVGLGGSTPRLHGKAPGSPSSQRRLTVALDVFASGWTVGWKRGGPERHRVMLPTPLPERAWPQSPCWAPVAVYLKPAGLACTPSGPPPLPRGPVRSGSGNGAQELCCARPSRTLPGPLSGMPGPHALPSVLENCSGGLAGTRAGGGRAGGHGCLSSADVNLHTSQMTLRGRTWKQVDCEGQRAFLPTPY